MPRDEVVDTFVELIDKLIKARIALANTSAEDHIANHDLVCDTKRELRSFIATQLEKEGQY